MVISGAVEGLVDEAVLRRLVEEAGATLGDVYGKMGKSHLRRRLHGYNQAAKFSPWVVLADLDQDANCAPPLRAVWLPDSAPHMCFRIAVREIESWLLADRKGIAHFLGVKILQIPASPETIEYPKRTLVGLARHSRRIEIRKDMVPGPRSRRRVGPAYSSQLIEFIRSKWKPDIAEQTSESLRRCRESVSRLTGI